VRADQEDADQRDRTELPSAQPEDSGAAPPGDESGEEDASDDEPRRDGEEGRHRLDRERDAEIRRSPDRVDGRERDPQPRVAAQTDVFARRSRLTARRYTLTSRPRGREQRDQSLRRLRGRAGPGPLRGARPALPQGRGGDVPPREGLRFPAGERADL